MGKFVESLSMRLRKAPDEVLVISLTPHEAALKHLEDRGVLTAAWQAIERKKAEQGEGETLHPHFELVPGGVGEGQLVTMWVRLSPEAVRLRTSPEIIERWKSVQTVVSLFRESISISSPRIYGNSAEPQWDPVGYPDVNLRRDMLAAGFYSAFSNRVLVHDMRTGVHPSRLEGSSEGNPDAQKIILTASARDRIFRLQPQLLSSDTTFSGS